MDEELSKNRNKLCYGILIEKILCCKYLLNSMICLVCLCQGNIQVSAPEKKFHFYKLTFQLTKLITHWLYWFVITQEVRCKVVRKEMNLFFNILIKLVYFSGCWIQHYRDKKRVGWMKKCKRVNFKIDFAFRRILDSRKLILTCG